MPATATARKAGVREWTGLAVLVLPCLLVSMDAHVLGLALPRLTAELRPTPAQLLWIVDSYAFLVAGALLPMGALGDRVGRRRMLLAGAAGFGTASLLAAFATSPGTLIVARVLLGLAGATLMPSTLALIRAMFSDPRQRRTAFGVWTAAFALGGVIAPVVAGIVLAHFWWGSVFLVAVPVMGALLVLGPVLLPEVRDAGAARVDATGAALSLAGVLGVVYGFKRAAGELDPAGLGFMAIGVVLVVAFLRAQRRRAKPWIDLGLLRRRTFAIPLATNALAFFVLYGTQFFVVQYLQLVLGLSPLHAGLWTIPSALAYLAGSMLAPVVAERTRPGRLMSASLAVTALGFGLLTQVGAEQGLPVVVAGSVIASLGLAPVYVLATEMTVAAAPAERSGSASGMLESCANLGGALGIAVLGTIGGMVYRAAMAGSGASGVPQHQWEEARRTLGAAMAAAARLGDPVAGELADAARTSFTLGFRTVEGVGAALLAVLAVATAVTLRRAGLERR